MPVRLCVLLWERTGCAEEVAAFEDAVLALLPRHGGRLIGRDVVTDGGADDPCEVQRIEFADEAGYSAYLADPERADLARRHRRDEIIARTSVLRLGDRD